MSHTTGTPTRPRGKLITLSAPNATQLHQAGLRFKVGSPKNLFDIKFKNGILEISNIRIHDYTEAFFRNLVAFEQCHMRVDYISDFFIALDRLIDKGVARNTYLGGPGCNRDILNMILKFIEYKIINFHISLYT